MIPNREKDKIKITNPGPDKVWERFRILTRAAVPPAPTQVKIATGILIRK